MTVDIMSPFPYRAKVSNPLERIRFCDIEEGEEIWEKIHSAVRLNTGLTAEYNPLIKIFKKDVVFHWLNKNFGSRAWDFEQDLEESEELTICFFDPELLSLFLLRWS